MANSSALPESENQNSNTMPRDEESNPVRPIQEKDSNIVRWDINDRDNPVNWCRNRKWTISLCMGLMTFVCTFASSVFSIATVATSELFGVSTEVMTLGVSLYVLVRYPSLTWDCEATDGGVGFCIWPYDMGSIERTIWSQSASFYRIYHLCDFSNTSGCCSESSNLVCLPFLGRSVRRCTLSNCWRCYGGHLGSC